MVDNNKTIRVPMKTTVQITTNEDGMPNVLIESAAPYSQIIQDARELYLELIDYQIEEDVEEDNEEDPETELEPIDQ